MGLHKRGAVYHYRVRVPRDLIEILERSELHQSLRTDSLSEARRLAKGLQARLEAGFQRLRFAQLAAIEREQLNRLVGEVLSGLGGPRRTGTRSGHPPAPRRLSDLTSLHLEEKREVLDPRSLQKMRYSFRLAVLLIGDIHLEQLNRSACRAYRDALAQTPQYALRQDAAAQKTDLLLSDKSVNHHLQYLSGLLRWAAREEIVPGNPAEGLCLQRKTRAWSEREAFTDTQLQRLFAGLWREEDRSDRRWIPLIGLWSGLRLEEICQLRFADIVQHQGIWCFSVNGEAGHLKTLAAERMVPIHPWLLERGVLEDIRGDRPEQRIWAELRQSSLGRYSNAIGKWFSRYKTQRGFALRAHCFHSLRHTFANALKQQHVPEPLIRQLIGHSEPSITLGRYGKAYEAEALAVAIRRLSFEIAV